MPDPYRDSTHLCPACRQPLRSYLTRLLCDACNGIFMPLADLGAGIHDMTSIDPTFTFEHEQPGKRLCPHCAQAMSTCKLLVGLDGHVEHPHPELDHCAAHGLWFDDQELAKVFEKVATKGFGGGVGRKASTKDRPADQGGWSAMFKYFGGRGGF